MVVGLDGLWVMHAKFSSAEYLDSPTIRIMGTSIILAELMLSSPIAPTHTGFMNQTAMCLDVIDIDLSISMIASRFTGLLVAIASGIAGIYRIEIEYTLEGGPAHRQLST